MPIDRWASLAALVIVAAACGSSSEAPIADGGALPDVASDSPDAGPAPAERRFPDVTAVKALAARGGWLVLWETLQTQLSVTIPRRRIVLLDERLQSSDIFHPVEGWTLIDAVAHPSGDVSALYFRLDYQDPFPARFQLTRYRPDGSRVDTEVAPVAPSDPSNLTRLYVASYDRARLVARGEDVYLAARWAGNAVYAYRFGFGAQGFQQIWGTRVEPDAELSLIGIIGGGFDNFHQGDNAIFVYLDVDGAGDTYVAVASGESVLEEHDAAFGDGLLAGADPEHFDFGTAILTRIDAQGRRVYASLLGIPGRNKSLLNLRAGDGSLFLVGRFKTGTEPDSWDAWILSARAATGALDFERTVDVEHGDMFWDAAVLPDRRILAVGSTNYTQNPSGLSVSDERDALAVLLDSQGRLVQRLELPRGATARGDEAMAVSLVDGGLLAIAGMLDGPGTHAEVRSDGFLDVRNQ